MTCCASILFGWPRGGPSNSKNQLTPGAANRIRTCDPVITNDVLYQLSYCGTAPEISAGGGLGKEGRRPPYWPAHSGWTTPGRRPAPPLRPPIQGASPVPHPGVACAAGARPGLSASASSHILASCVLVYHSCVNLKR